MLVLENGGPWLVLADPADYVEKRELEHGIWLYSQHTPSVCRNPLLFPFIF
jgi:hypothetical protein